MSKYLIYRYYIAYISIVNTSGIIRFYKLIEMVF